MFGFSRALVWFLRLGFLAGPTTRYYIEECRSRLLEVYAVALGKGSCSKGYTES